MGVAMILTIAAQAQNVGKYGSKLVISGVKAVKGSLANGRGTGYDFDNCSTGSACWYGSKLVISYVREELFGKKHHKVQNLYYTVWLLSLF